MKASLFLLVAGAVIAAATLGALGFAVVRRILLRRRLARLAKTSRLPRSCLLIRPCAGSESKLFESLYSVVHATRDFPIKVIIGMDDEEDSARSAALAARDVLNAAGIETAVTVTPLIGPNRKSAILAGCIRSAGEHAEAVIVADSNVDLSGFDLNRLLLPLFSEARIGAVWVPFRETCNTPTFGNIASQAVLHSSWHSFGLLSAVDPRGMVGKLFAVSKEGLEAVDNFQGTTRVLGEDMALARMLREHGKELTVLPTAVASPTGPKTFGETLKRHVRWMMVIKGQRTALLLAYPLLFFNSLLLYTFAMISASDYPEAAMSLAGAALFIRVLVGFSAARMVDVRPSALLILHGICIADPLLFFAFLKTLFTRKFNWRGRHLAINRLGVLEENGPKTQQIPLRCKTDMLPLKKDGNRIRSQT